MPGPNFALPGVGPIGPSTPLIGPLFDVPPGSTPTPSANATLTQAADGSWVWVDKTTGQPLSPQPNTPPAAAAAPAAGATPTAPAAGGSQILNTSTDPNAVTKVTSAVSAFGGAFQPLAVADDTSDTQGNLTVTVKNANGDIGQMTLGPQGNIVQPPYNPSDNKPLQAANPGTGAAQKTAAAATQNADTNQSKTQASIQQIQSKGGYLWTADPTTGQPIAIGPDNAVQAKAMGPQEKGGDLWQWDDDKNTWVDTGPIPLTAAQKTQAGQQQVQDQLTAQRDADNAAAQKAAADAANVRNDLQAKMDDWTKQYQQQQIDEATYRDNLTAANQQAQQAIDKANLALKQAEDSQTKWYQQQQVGIQQGQLANQTAAQTETGRHNVAGEQQAQAALAQQGQLAGMQNNQQMLSTLESARQADMQNQAQQQQARTQGATAGANILDTRAQQAGGLLTNIAGQVINSQVAVTRVQCSWN